MYPWIPWELFAGPLGSAGHTLGTTALGQIHKTNRNEMGQFFVVGQCWSVLRFVAHSIFTEALH